MVAKSKRESLCYEQRRYAETDTSKGRRYWCRIVSSRIFCTHVRYPCLCSTNCIPLGYFSLLLDTDMTWRRPYRRDKVYSSERFLNDKQPNGYIAEILWEDREVVVNFYINGSKEEDQEVYSFEDFEDNWTDAYGGSWFL